jgi:Fic family protein
MRKRGADARTLIEYLYKNPVISTTDVVQLIGKTPQTAYNLIAHLEKEAILEELTGAQRNKLYSFAPYMKIFETL